MTQGWLLTDFVNFIYSVISSSADLFCVPLCWFAVRIRDHVIGTMEAHEQEVCGLKWSLSGQQLASGGNDNLLHIWDAAAASTQGPSPYLHRLDDHRAAVKALAWCPFQSNLLASGGGTADRCIKFWNTHTGACLNSIDTQSQVSLNLINHGLVLQDCQRLVFHEFQSCFITHSGPVSS